MSCGQIALNELGIKPTKYFASELDKPAMAVTKRNYPKTIHIGDVSKVSYKDGILQTERGSFHCPIVDLFMGGSPCQNLSRAVINNIKHNQGLKGTKSSLFYEYVRILTEVKAENPQLKFFFENVSSMKNEDRALIPLALEVKPIQINSKLMTAQNRDRLYYCNSDTEILPPTDSGITLGDIVLTSIPASAWYEQNHSEHQGRVILNVNSHEMLKRVHRLTDKCGCLTKISGGYQHKKVFFNMIGVANSSLSNMRDYKGFVTTILSQPKTHKDIICSGTVGLFLSLLTF